MPKNVSIPDKKGSMITIKRKEPSLANEYLGIKLTLTFNQDEQNFKKKVKTFASQISKKRRDKTSALWTFKQNFVPYMSYAMVVTQFLEDKCCHANGKCNNH